MVTYDWTFFICPVVVNASSTLPPDGASLRVQIYYFCHVGEWWDKDNPVSNVLLLRLVLRLGLRLSWEDRFHEEWLPKEDSHNLHRSMQILPTHECRSPWTLLQGSRERAQSISGLIGNFLMLSSRMNRLSSPCWKTWAGRGLVICWLWVASFLCCFFTRHNVQNLHPCPF